MAKIGMNIPELRQNSNKWLELEEECINIVKSIDMQLENISNDALKTPMLKDEFDKLRLLYMQIEKNLNTNINTIKAFFDKQFETYDRLGSDIAESTSNVSDSISGVGEYSDKTFATPITEISDSIKEQFLGNSNSGIVNSNLDELQANMISGKNTLENLGSHAIKTPIEREFQANINTGSDELPQSVIDGVKFKPGVLDSVSSSNNDSAGLIDYPIESNFDGYNPGVIELDPREKEGFLSPENH